MKNLKYFFAFIFLIILVQIGCTPDTQTLVTRFRPGAFAGQDDTITSPLSSVTLKGQGYLGAADQGIIKVQWIQLYSTTAKIINPILEGQLGSLITLETLVEELKASTVPTQYYFRFLVTDLHGDQADDTVVITVLPEVTSPNQSPTAIAGPDQTITLPTSTVTLSGSGTDADGTIAKYAWTQVSVTAAMIVSPDSASTNIKDLTAAGVYVFRLTVTDNQGAPATDDVTVTVLDVAPSANNFTIIAEPPDTTEFTVQYTHRIANTFALNGNNATFPHPDIMWFYVYSDTSFPLINSVRHYKISPNPVAGQEIKITVTHYIKLLAVFYTFICTGTDNVIVDIENRNGELYITMPKAEAVWDSGPDSIHVIANVHQL